MRDSRIRSLSLLYRNTMMPTPARRSSSGSRFDRLQRLLGIKERRRVFKRRLMMESLETRRVLANIEVTSLLDTTELNDGVITLREAIVVANEVFGADTITFAPSLSGPIVLTQGQLSITDSLNITGNGATNTIIDADDKSRVISITGTSVDVTIDGVTITRGLAQPQQSNGDGGGILFDSTGSLTVANSTVFENISSGNGGGLSTKQGRLVLSNSTVSGNRASFAGGGLFNASNAQVRYSTLQDNTALLFGGGVNNSNTGTLLVASSTLSGNSANANPSSTGGGIQNEGSVTITNSTLTGNTTASQGGELFNTGPASAIILSSIFAQPSETGSSIAGTGTVIGSSNLINTPSSTGGLLHGVNGNIIGQAGPGGTRVFLPVGSVLAPLAENGGPTKTHALVPGSPAIDAGEDTGSVTNDQRGSKFPRLFGPRIDIGAFEALADAPKLYVVNTLSDEFDFSNTNVSLREALYAANYFVETALGIANNIITFSPTLTSSGPATITLTQGELPITDTVQIVGPGPGLLAIDAISNRGSSQFSQIARSQSCWKG